MAAIGREKTFAAAAAAAAAAADDDDDAAGAEEKTAQRRRGSLADAGRRIDFTAVFFLVSSSLGCVMANSIVTC